VVAAGLLLVLAGCRDSAPVHSASTPQADPTSVPTAASTPKSTSTASKRSQAVVPGAKCLHGRWRLVRFTSQGGPFDFGTGRGGDVTMSFDKGRYSMVGKGKKPIRVKRQGESADLRIDGTVKGTHAPDGKGMAFTVGHATGSATVTYEGERQRLPMASVADMVAPNGKATLGCSQNVLTITLSSVRLRLER
jgi:hypothetical protein